MDPEQDQSTKLVALSSSETLPPSAAGPRAAHPMGVPDRVSSALGACNYQLKSRLVTVESRAARGFAGLQLVGSIGELVREGKERARTALEAVALPLPPQKIVVSLTPGDFKIDGNQFDLPIAISLAQLLSGDPTRDLRRWLFIGELGLGGELRRVRGTIGFALMAMSKDLQGIVIPRCCLGELQTIFKLLRHPPEQFEVIACDTLSEVLHWLYGDAESRRVGLQLTPGAELERYNPDHQDPNFDDMILSRDLERVAEAVATGGHHLLLSGSPGAGKSMFSRRLPSVLPPIAGQQHLEVLQIYSHAGSHIPRSLLESRPPYRSPHHSASSVALLGTPETPGELALAHGGVLFLDEFPEFRRDLREALREPLETGQVQVSRAQAKATWSADIVLLAACNPCPCGWADSLRPCCCGQPQIEAYRRRLSGPLLDRIDIHYRMPHPQMTAAEMLVRLGEGVRGQTRRMFDRIVDARAFGICRARTVGLPSNRELAPPQLLKASGLSEKSFTSLLAELNSSHPTRRSIVRCVRVARTLADLDQRSALTRQDIQQAWKWRPTMLANEQRKWERGAMRPSDQI